MKKPIEPSTQAAVLHEVFEALRQTTMVSRQSWRDLASLGAFLTGHSAEPDLFSPEDLERFPDVFMEAFDQLRPITHVGGTRNTLLSGLKFGIERSLDDEKKLQAVQWIFGQKEIHGYNAFTRRNSIDYEGKKFMLQFPEILAVIFKTPDFESKVYPMLLSAMKAAKGQTDWLFNKRIRVLSPAASMIFEQMPAAHLQRAGEDFLTTLTQIGPAKRSQTARSVSHAAVDDYEKPLGLLFAKMNSLDLSLADAQLIETLQRLDPHGFKVSLLIVNLIAKNALKRVGWTSSADGKIEKRLEGVIGELNNMSRLTVESLQTIQDGLAAKQQAGAESALTWLNEYSSQQEAIAAAEGMTADLTERTGDGGQSRADQNGLWVDTGASAFAGVGSGNVRAVTMRSEMRSLKDQIQSWQPIQMPNAGAQQNRYVLENILDQLTEEPRHYSVEDPLEWVGILADIFQKTARDNTQSYESAHRSAAIVMQKLLRQVNITQFRRVLAQDGVIDEKYRTAFESEEARLGTIAQKILPQIPLYAAMISGNKTGRLSRFDLAPSEIYQVLGELAAMAPAAFEKNLPDLFTTLDALTGRFTQELHTMGILALLLARIAGKANADNQLLIAQALIRALDRLQKRSASFLEARQEVAGAFEVMLPSLDQSVWPAVADSLLASLARIQEGKVPAQEARKVTLRVLKAMAVSSAEASLTLKIVNAMADIFEFEKLKEGEFRTVLIPDLIHILAQKELSDYAYLKAEIFKASRLLDSAWQVVTQQRAALSGLRLDLLETNAAFRILQLMARIALRESGWGVQGYDTINRLGGLIADSVLPSAADSLQRFNELVDALTNWKQAHPNDLEKIFELLAGRNAAKDLSAARLVAQAEALDDVKPQDRAPSDDSIWIRSAQTRRSEMRSTWALWKDTIRDWQAPLNPADMVVKDVRILQPPLTPAAMDSVLNVLNSLIENAWRYDGNDDERLDLIEILASLYTKAPAIEFARIHRAAAQAIENYLPKNQDHLERLSGVAEILLRQFEKYDVGTLSYSQIESVAVLSRTINRFPRTVQLRNTEAFELVLIRILSAIDQHHRSEMDAAEGVALLLGRLAAFAAPPNRVLIAAALIKNSKTFNIPRSKYSSIAQRQRVLAAFVLAFSELWPLAAQAQQEEIFDELLKLLPKGQSVSALKLRQVIYDVLASIAAGADDRVLSQRALDALSAQLNAEGITSEEMQKALMPALSRGVQRPKDILSYDDLVTKLLVMPRLDARIERWWFQLLARIAAQKSQWTPLTDAQLLQSVDFMRELREIRNPAEANAKFEVLVDQLREWKQANRGSLDDLLTQLKSRSAAQAQASAQDAARADAPAEFQPQRPASDADIWTATPGLPFPGSGNPETSRSEMRNDELDGLLDEWDRLFPAESTIKPKHSPKAKKLLREMGKILEYRQNAPVRLIFQHNLKDLDSAVPLYPLFGFMTREQFSFLATLIAEAMNKAQDSSEESLVRLDYLSMLSAVLYTQHGRVAQLMPAWLSALQRTTGANELGQKIQDTLARAIVEASKQGELQPFKDAPRQLLEKLNQIDGTLPEAWTTQIHLIKALGHAAEWMPEDQVPKAAEAFKKILEKTRGNSEEVYTTFEETAHAISRLVRRLNNDQIRTMVPALGHVLKEIDGSLAGSSSAIIEISNTIRYMVELVDDPTLARDAAEPLLRVFQRDGLMELEDVGEAVRHALAYVALTAAGYSSAALPEVWHALDSLFSEFIDDDENGIWLFTVGGWDVLVGNWQSILEILSQSDLSPRAMIERIQQLRGRMETAYQASRMDEQKANGEGTPKPDLPGDTTGIWTTTQRSEVRMLKNYSAMNAQQLLDEFQSLKGADRNTLEAKTDIARIFESRINDKSLSVSKTFYSIFLNGLAQLKVSEGTHWARWAMIRVISAALKHETDQAAVELVAAEAIAKLELEKGTDDAANIQRWTYANLLQGIFAGMVLDGWVPAVLLLRLSRTKNALIHALERIQGSSDEANYARQVITGALKNTFRMTWPHHQRDTPLVFDTVLAAFEQLEGSSDATNEARAAIAGVLTNIIQMADSRNISGIDSNRLARAYAVQLQEIKGGTAEGESARSYILKGLSWVIKLEDPAVNTENLKQVLAALTATLEELKHADRPDLKRLLEHLSGIVNVLRTMIAKIEPSDLKKINDLLIQWFSEITGILDENDDLRIHLSRLLAVVAEKTLASELPAMLRAMLAGLQKVRGVREKSPEAAKEMVLVMERIAKRIDSRYFDEMIPPLVTLLKQSENSFVNPRLTAAVLATIATRLAGLEVTDAPGSQSREAPISLVLERIFADLSQDEDIFSRDDGIFERFVEILKSAHGDAAAAEQKLAAYAKQLIALAASEQKAADATEQIMPPTAPLSGDINSIWTITSDLSFPHVFGGNLAVLRSEIRKSVLVALSAALVALGPLVSLYSNGLGLALATAGVGALGYLWIQTNAFMGPDAYFSELITRQTLVEKYLIQLEKFSESGEDSRNRLWKVVDNLRQAAKAVDTPLVSKIAVALAKNLKRLKEFKFDTNSVHYEMARALEEMAPHLDPSVIPEIIPELIRTLGQISGVDKVNGSLRWHTNLALRSMLLWSEGYSNLAKVKSALIYILILHDKGRSLITEEDIATIRSDILQPGKDKGEDWVVQQLKSFHDQKFALAKRAAADANRASESAPPEKPAAGSDNSLWSAGLNAAARSEVRTDEYIRMSLDQLMNAMEAVTGSDDVADSTRSEIAGALKDTPHRNTINTESYQRLLDLLFSALAEVNQRDTAFARSAQIAIRKVLIDMASRGSLTDVTGILQRWNELLSPNPDDLCRIDTARLFNIAVGKGYKNLPPLAVVLMAWLDKVKESSDVLVLRERTRIALALERIAREITVSYLPQLLQVLIKSWGLIPDNESESDEAFFATSSALANTLLRLEGYALKKSRIHRSLDVALSIHFKGHQLITTADIELIRNEILQPGKKENEEWTLAKIENFERNKIAAAEQAENLASQVSDGKKSVLREAEATDIWTVTSAALLPQTYNPSFPQANAASRSEIRKTMLKTLAVISERQRTILTALSGGVAILGVFHLFLTSPYPGIMFVLCGVVGIFSNLSRHPAFLTRLIEKLLVHLQQASHQGSIGINIKLAKTLKRFDRAALPKIVHRLVGVLAEMNGADDSTNYKKWIIADSLGETITRVGPRTLSALIPDFVQILQRVEGGIMASHLTAVIASYLALILLYTEGYTLKTQVKQALSDFLAMYDGRSLITAEDIVIIQNDVLRAGKEHGENWMLAKIESLELAKLAAIQQAEADARRASEPAAPKKSPADTDRSDIWAVGQNAAARSEVRVPLELQETLAELRQLEGDSESINQRRAQLSDKASDLARQSGDSELLKLTADTLISEFDKILQPSPETQHVQVMFGFALRDLLVVLKDPERSAQAARIFMRIFEKTSGPSREMNNLRRSLANSLKGMVLLLKDGEVQKQVLEGTWTELSKIQGATMATMEDSWAMQELGFVLLNLFRVMDSSIAIEPALATLLTALSLPNAKGLASGAGWPAIQSMSQALAFGLLKIEGYGTQSPLEGTLVRLFRMHDQKKSRLDQARFNEIRRMILIPGKGQAFTETDLKLRNYYHDWAVQIVDELLLKLQNDEVKKGAELAYEISLLTSRLVGLLNELRDSERKPRADLFQRVLCEILWQDQALSDFRGKIMMHLAKIFALQANLELSDMNLHQEKSAVVKKLLALKTGEAGVLADIFMASRSEPELLDRLDRYGEQMEALSQSAQLDAERSKASEGDRRLAPGTDAGNIWTATSASVRSEVRSSLRAQLDRVLESAKKINQNDIYQGLEPYWKTEEALAEIIWSVPLSQLNAVEAWMNAVLGRWQHSERITQIVEYGLRQLDYRRHPAKLTELKTRIRAMVERGREMQKEFSGINSERIDFRNKISKQVEEIRDRDMQRLVADFFMDEFGEIQEPLSEAKHALEMLSLELRNVLYALKDPERTAKVAKLFTAVFSVTEGSSHEINGLRRSLGASLFLIVQFLKDVEMQKQLLNAVLAELSKIQGDDVHASWAMQELGYVVRELFRHMDTSNSRERALTQVLALLPIPDAVDEAAGAGRLAIQSFGSALAVEVLRYEGYGNQSSLEATLSRLYGMRDHKKSRLDRARFDAIKQILVVGKTRNVTEVEADLKRYYHAWSVQIMDELLGKLQTEPITQQQVSNFEIRALVKMLADLFETELDVSEQAARRGLLQNGLCDVFFKIKDGSGSSLLQAATTREKIAKRLVRMFAFNAGVGPEKTREWGSEAVIKKLLDLNRGKSEALADIFMAANSTEQLLDRLGRYGEQMEALSQSEQLDAQRSEASEGDRRMTSGTDAGNIWTATLASMRSEVRLIADQLEQQEPQAQMIAHNLTVIRQARTAVQEISHAIAAQVFENIDARRAQALSRTDAWVEAMLALPKENQSKPLAVFGDTFSAYGVLRSAESERALNHFGDRLAQILNAADIPTKEGIGLPGQAVGDAKADFSHAQDLLAVILSMKEKVMMDYELTAEWNSREDRQALYQGLVDAAMNAALLNPNLSIRIAAPDRSVKGEMMKLLSRGDPTKVRMLRSQGRIRIMDAREMAADLNLQGPADLAISSRPAESLRLRKTRVSLDGAEYANRQKITASPEASPAQLLLAGLAALSEKTVRGLIKNSDYMIQIADEQTLRDFEMLTHLLAQEAAKQARVQAAA